MSTLRFASPLFVVASAVTLAQVPAAPEMSTHDAPAIFTSRVNLVLVPVVVRDRNGKAMGTLRQEDFQLSDKGKPQVITRFSVEKTGSPSIPTVVATDETAPEKPQPEPAPIPERFVAYVFDDVHLTIQDVLWARDAADRHLAEFLEPTTRAAIFTTSGQVTVDFTDDRDKLREALKRIQPRSGSISNDSECPPLTFYMADAILNKHDTQLENAVIADTYVCLGIDPSQPGAQQIVE